MAKTLVKIVASAIGVGDSLEVVEGVAGKVLDDRA